MKTVAVIYQSKTGITKKYGEGIGAYLKDQNIDATIAPIQEFDPEKAGEYDILLLGCWTSGLFIFLQHPDKEWVEFARKIPPLTDQKVGLFTTYKLATGSMFKKMKMHLKGNVSDDLPAFKSKNGELSEEDKERLMSIVT